MSDIEIAKSSKMKKINEITDKLGIPEEYVENYGKYKAKISIKYLEKISKEESYGKLAKKKAMVEFTKKTMKETMKKIMKKA